MSYDWLDDSIDHEVERMISQIRVPKWMSKPNPPPGLSWIQHFAWANKHRVKQLERMKRYRERRKAGLVLPRPRKLTAAQKRARNRKHAQAYRDRQPKKPKTDRRNVYLFWRRKHGFKDAIERARRRAQRDAEGK